MLSKPAAAKMLKSQKFVLPWPEPESKSENPNLEQQIRAGTMTRLVGFLVHCGKGCCLLPGGLGALREWMLKD